MSIFDFPAPIPVPGDFLELRRRYSRYFAGDVASPPVGWLNLLELALSEAEGANQSFSISGFTVSAAGLIPIFSKGDSPSLRELLAEARHFCPFCGQAYPYNKGGK